jgi:excisionase family DNA binding protein
MEDKNRPPPLFVSRRSAAWSLAISLRTLDELLAMGVIRSLKLGKRRLVLASELERLAANATK